MKKIYLYIFVVLCFISLVTLFTLKPNNKLLICNNISFILPNQFKSLECSDNIKLSDTTQKFTIKIQNYKQPNIFITDDLEKGVDSVVVVNSEELVNINSLFVTFKDGGWEVAQKPAGSQSPSYQSVQEKMIENSYLKSSSPISGQVYSVYQKTEGGYTTELDFGNDKKLSISYECKIDLVCWPLFKNDFFELVKSIEVK
jgi:hypothetical protein